MNDLYWTKFWLKLFLVILFLSDDILCITFCPTAVWTPNATTIAGSRRGAASSTLTGLDEPTNVLVDNNGTIYVADNLNYRVLQFLLNSTTGIVVINGSFGNGLNQFSSMDSMSMDMNGSIYILDSVLARVTKWIPGASTGILIVGGAPFINFANGSLDNMNDSSGMFIEQSNTMYIWIADTGNSRIVKWINSSTAVVVCGSYGTQSNQFKNPAGLFVDTNAGNVLYVADTFNHRVQMWLVGATNGITVAGITSYYGNRLDQLSFPSTLIVDTNANMFIVDSYNSRIVKWKVGATAGMIIAGSDQPGTTIYQLNTPLGISFNSNGSLFVADTENNRIQMFNISCLTMNTSTTTIPSITTTQMPISTTNCSRTIWATNATTIAGSSFGENNYSPQMLSFPADVWVNKDGSIYVLDYGNYRVQLYLPGASSGITVINSTSGTDLDQFSYMDAFSVDINGSIYIVDDGNARVTKWSPGTTTGVIVAGGNDQGSALNQLNYPFGLFVEMNTSIIWIADTENCRIVKWTSLSKGVLVAGSTSCGSKSNQLNYPYGIFVYASLTNILYVVDTGNHRIQMWSEGGSSGTTVAGQTAVSGKALNQLSSPFAIIVDENRSMYIVDYGNHRIMLWMFGSTSGVVIAGTNSYGTLPDQLYNPNSIRFDSNGALIVADTNNNRIQKFNVICSPTMKTIVTSSPNTSTSIIASVSSTTVMVQSNSSMTTQTQNLTTTVLSSTVITSLSPLSRTTTTTTTTMITSTKTTTKMITSTKTSQLLSTSTVSSGQSDVLFSLSLISVFLTFYAYFFMM